MKTIIVAFLCLPGLVGQLQAQRPSGMGGGQGMQMPEFNARDMAEILILDAKVVAKRSKVESEEIEKCIELTNAYNRSIDSLEYIHSGTLDQLEKEMKASMESAMQNRNFQAIRISMEQSRAVLGPIADQAKQIRENYMTDMKSVLNDKSYKKFDKYLSSKVRAMQPQTQGGGMMPGGTGNSRGGF